MYSFLIRRLCIGDININSSLLGDFTVPVKSPLDKYFLGRSRVDFWTGEPKMCLPPQPNIGTKQQAPIPLFRCPAVGA